MSWAGLPAWARYGGAVLLAAAALVVGVILAVTAWSGTPDRPAAVSGSASTVARDASIVYAEMELAAARAGAVAMGDYLDALPARDSCRACPGADWFRAWCGASGGRIVRVSDSDSGYFADGGPVYCYPGARPLPQLIDGPYRSAFDLVGCLPPDTNPYFIAPARTCPAGTTKLRPDQVVD